MDSKQDESAHASGRTGGQYSLVRAALGMVLFVKFVEAALATQHVHPAPSLAMLLLALAGVLALLLALGWQDVKAGVGLLLVWSYMALVLDWHTSGSDGLLICLVTAHLCLSCCRPLPYGSWSMRGRLDPAGGWQAPEAAIDLLWLLYGLWLLAACAHFWSSMGVQGWAPDWAQAHQAIQLILGLSLGACAYWRRAWRLYAWTGLLLHEVITLLLLGLRMDLWQVRFLGAWLFMLLLFEPRWIKPRRSGAQELVFYDGECGLCHRAVRFLLSEDLDGRAFLLAPLQGETFASRVSAEQRAQLPDSLIVRCDDGRLLTNSSGIVHMLLALGGLWRVAGSLLFVIPRPLRDAGYRFIACIRKRLFAAPKSLCPLLPPELGTRFLP